ncbi:NADH-quinone oxidoreductase subunit NuoI [Kyrpidia tusciae]|uniref:NADH-quinone oxidoreductase subunit I n=1 Tax=Kyrpidia tusciae (strain DSM 2912 / NBRC 15312 / T2) TaxID=562970 RepID=D5WV48_KYRT2|nr:NADH-quinone oxidoreductase subunit NuoI [Kyrpidia tusciae]ADG07520.1 4Fe-4S ferredoxin iron-sulfur binding domain protein [Kyrpidia tusciae DSM 2912]MBE3552467.1 NADH-quinone oxidoreductase subunit NuoI [Kyrpidia tusciae]
MFGGGVLKGLTVTLKEMIRPKVTTRYPDETYTFPNRFRGIQKLYPEKCIVCNQCAMVCPTQCITIRGKPHPDPAKKGKVLETFEIHFDTCILCDLCTEVCPTEAIVMTNQFELAEYTRDALQKDMTWLTENPAEAREVNLPWRKT